MLFRSDPAHLGVNPNETILSPANVANLAVKWRTNIGGGCFASASIFEGKLYTADTGSADGKLHEYFRSDIFCKDTFH